MQEREQTFLFADLAGYTALTEAHGDEESAELTSQFFSAVRGLVDEHGAGMVRTIGDAVMIRADSAAEAVKLGLRIRSEVGTRHGFPSIRIGMHTGRATERSGDWFGSTVNTAARVSGVATGGEVLATDTTRQAAGRVKGVDFQERGRYELRNVGEPMLLCACILHGERTPDDLPIDPVCRMAIASARAAARVTYQGVEYQFCSLQCARRFSTAPERYAGEGVPRGVGRFRTAAALIQGGSYVGFGLWSVVAREHYRRVHEIRRHDWLLNAHGAWLVAVGSTLVAAALRREAVRPEIRFLGAGSALGLAINDIVLLRRLPQIYQADVAFELALAGAWLVPGSTRG